MSHHYSHSLGWVTITKQDAGCMGSPCTTWTSGINCLYIVLELQGRSSGPAESSLLVHSQPTMLYIKGGVWTYEKRPLLGALYPIFGKAVQQILVFPGIFPWANCWIRWPCGVCSTLLFFGLYHAAHCKIVLSVLSRKNIHVDIFSCM